MPDEWIDSIAAAMAEYVAPRDDAIRDLRREVDRQQGQIDALLTLLGKSADVKPLRSVK